MRLSQNVNGLQHIGWPANDADKTVAWLCDNLDFTVAFQNGARFLRRGALVLEVYPVEEPPFETEGGFWDAIALTVTDLDEAATRLGFGCAPVETVLSDGTRLSVLEGKGPDGERVLVQTASDAAGQPRVFDYLRAPVADLNEAAAFLAEFGFDQLCYLQEEVDGTRVGAVLLELGGWYVKLYEKPGFERASARDAHTDHMALDVKDIDKAFTTACALGFELLHDSVQGLPFWQNGVRFFTLRAPDGHKVELSEML